jgi:hypothetical protein
VRSGSNYLRSLLGAASPVGAGSAGTLRPPRRIFDAVPEPEVASASPLHEPLEAAAVPIRSAPVGEPGAARSAPSVLATPGPEPDGRWPSPPVPSAEAARIESHGLLSPRSIHASPAAGQGLPDLVPAVSHLADLGSVAASGDDLFKGAEAVPRSPGAPSGAALHPVADRPPAAVPAPPTGRSPTADRGAMVPPPAGVPALPAGRRGGHDDPGSAPGFNDARHGAVRPSALDPPKLLSDEPPPQFAAGLGPGSRHLAATGVEPGVTIGTIEVTVAPPPAPAAVPQTPSPAPAPAPAPAGPVALGRRGAMEAARMGSRRWFGAGQG